MPNPPEYCLFFIDWWGTCMQKSEWASWVQAFGSIAAICAAIGIVLFQHSLERKRFAKEKLREVVALQFAALQLIGAIHGLAQKVQQSFAVVPGPTPFVFNDFQFELEGAVSALGRVDHLRFDSHELIEALQVAESIGKSILRQIELSLNHYKNTGEFVPTSIPQYADRCVVQLKPRMDAIYKRVTAMSVVASR